MIPLKNIEIRPWFLAGNREADRALRGGQEPLVTRTLWGCRMLISALVTFLVVILILYLINLLPIDGRAKQIARVIVIILGVISLLKYIAVF
jgi:Na+/melibiose symporter-like transporter